MFPSYSIYKEVRTLRGATSLLSAVMSIVFPNQSNSEIRYLKFKQYLHGMRDVCNLLFVEFLFIVSASMHASKKEIVVAEPSAFFSIWAQDSSYWLVVEGPNAAAVPSLATIYTKPSLAAVKTPANWQASWVACAAYFEKQMGGATGYRAAVIPADTLPQLDEVMMALKPVSEINAIAANLWLADYVNHGRLDCYMQRVTDRRGKQVGYEAFARMEGPDGGVIGGGAIMQAAHALRVEYQIDRLLHKHAIESFVASDLEGYIFINFLTGFIHRPEVYLDGLSQAVNRTHVRPASVVLDVPLSDYAKDMPKLKSIASYCRARGFGLALDDVMTSDGLAALLADIRPAFVKIDGKLAAGKPAARAEAILQDIVRISHANGVSVLAEGVETAEQHAFYLAAEVDMFQGYLFGAPERFARQRNGFAAAGMATNG
jgi:EAL domain-containing protein (putative c-di-GMP-specific phosphodiesterase class I)